tara:strand:+ start:67 stop:303 length:237 start_codon:yes stop_codon:yes gene_type:complete
MTTIMRHAYFSQQQKEMILRKPRSRDMDNTPHTNIYLTVDGREVEVTEVIKTKPNHHQKNFSDSQYLGMVTKWLRAKY